MAKQLSKLITLCFYLLFFATPLLFTSLNYELFEFNKMVFVYFLTIFITGTWVISMVIQKRWMVKKTPLDLPILIFFLSQVISTILSIDPHTSIWGYYSRSNGGLLSTICYILLFYALVSNYSSLDSVQKFLKATLLGGLIVALWAIPEHFGHSLSCLLLTGSFNDSCWVQDVKSRVFASLGQPNWLAAYMGMLIFPSLYFALTSRRFLQTIIYLLLAIIYYLAFTFTYSISGFGGMLAGVGVFLVGFLLSSLRRQESRSRVKAGMTLLGILLMTFLLVNLFFGSAIYRFKLFTQSSPPPSPAQAGSVSQIEAGGTESGQIRKIVWKGALDIFKHYPLFGSGVETFAYSYYMFRPIEHNLTSEWDFLYNKAHNEYLNYLSTTGIVGLGAYLFVIFSFIFWSIKMILARATGIEQRILFIALLASYISYLVQNAAQFSVVIIATLFFTFPALAFIPLAEKETAVPEGVKNGVGSFIGGLIYRRPVYTRVINVLLILIMAYLSLNVALYWLADTHFAKGTHLLSLGYGSRAFNEFSDAEDENSREPLYKSNLGLTASFLAQEEADKDATLSAKLKDVAESETQKALKDSPQNVTLWRTAYKAYYQLTGVDPNFKQKTLDAINKTISLSPTDPKVYYDKAQILSSFQQTDAAFEAINKAIELKPNYKEAYFTLSELYQDKNQKDLAIEQMNKVLKFLPNDADALNRIKELQGK